MNVIDRTLPTDETRTGPAGLTLRPYAGTDDVAVIVDIINRELEADGVPFRESVGEVGARYAHASAMFEPARDVTIAEIDGTPVAYGERSWVDTTLDNLREYRVDGAVVPEWRQRGIGTALHRENVRRARELAALQQSDRTRVLGSWSSDRMTGAQALLRANGFETVRWFFEMTRPLDEPIPDLPLPTGLEVRPITPDLVLQVWRADIEAFQDHWGGFDDSDESLQRWLSRPDFDPTLWVVAFDGDEVAGASINAISQDENAALGIKRGWLHSVFTRRKWRRRGLAGALVARSLVMLKERGLDTGILGVDADNPTGALGVYERVGFGVAERSTAWRKPLEG
jgi:mycothiol synthase